MMNIPSAGALLISAMIATSAMGAVTTTVVDVPTRGVTQRFLYLHPDAPAANIVVLPGGDGFLGIQDDGTMTTFTAGCNPVARNRQAFADHGFAVALVDAASDGSTYNFSDVLEVIRYVQARDNVPTWLIGGSTDGGDRECCRQAAHRHAGRRDLLLTHTSHIAGGIDQAPDAGPL
jgi:hypothetical protein